MHFQLDPDILEFKEQVKEFARKEIYPSAEDRDREQRWDPEIWKKMGQMGLLGLPFPEEYGGQGASCLMTTAATEGFAAGAYDGGLTLAWGANTIIGSMPIVLTGTEEQKKRILPKIASGEWIAGLGLTEPYSGSDAAGSMRTRAVKKGDRYILNGSKMFITNGPIGDVFIVMAVTNPGKGAMGISAFIVEKSFKGFSAGKPLHKMGMHTSTTSELIFEDMEVPAENMLGKENLGFLRIGKMTLEWERTVLVASATGSMEAMLDDCVRYAKNREQFGRSILRNQAIQQKIARTRTLLDSSRLLLYRVAIMKDQGKSAPIESSVAKVFCTEAAKEAADHAVQIHGGYGYIHEYPVERGYRDVRLGTIGGGTSEVMRSIIAANLK